MKIHGKEYMEVNVRLQIFRRDYPDYSLESEWIRLDEQIAFCRAVIRNASDRLIATGTAYEEISTTGVNSTSHVENCETSAWGRALGNLGIGLDTAVCSAEEVKQAIDRQEQKPDKVALEKTAVKTKPVVPKSEFPKICKEYFGKYGDRCSIALYEFGKGEYKVAKDIPLARQDDFIKELKKLDSDLPF